MTIKRMSSGGEFEAKVGYCRAVVAGGFVYVSGCVGVDRATGDVPDDVTQQCRLALDIISDALADAGSSFAKAVRSASPTCCPTLRTLNHAGPFLGPRLVRTRLLQR